MIGLGYIVFGVLPLLAVIIVAWFVYLEHRRDRIPILLYHRLIAKSDAEKGLVPDTEMIWVSYDTRFAEQMDYLKAGGFTTIDLDDYLAIRSGRMPPPEKPVLVTFDDGYLSNYKLAYPALKRNGQKAVIFVPPEPDEYTRNIVRGVDGFLNADQMRELVAGGVAIESHTLTHCVLNELDDETAMHELTESKRRLAEITGRPVEHVAIPRAGYSRRIRRLVERAGYRTACCNNKGSATGWSDPLALPRIVIERDMSLEDFARALSPRGALALRVVGNLTRIPEFLGGSGFARKVRRVLYGSPLGPLFETRNLRRVILAAGLLYCLAGTLFWGRIGRIW
jgi:peptidoglycan/xylan/chitin deacetylase (PgdA/CDA1 family)